ncbi:MAG: ABC transporter permease subunit [Dermatophilaceae bacterium]
MRTARPGDGHGLALLAPAVVLVLAVVGVGVGSLVATSLGLMPLFGEARLSGRGFIEAAPDLFVGVRESLLIAAPSTALALLVGVPAGLLLHAGAARARGAVGGAVGLVVAAPHLVGAAAFALLLSGGGSFARLVEPIGQGWPELVGARWPVATVLVFAWKESAFVALVVVATLGTRVDDLADAARTLGATRFQRLRTVTLPLAAPGAAAAGIIVFVYAVGAYEVAWLLGGAYPEPLPVMAYRLYGSIDLAARPQAAATALVAITVAVAAAGSTIPVLRRLGAAR